VEAAAGIEDKEICVSCECGLAGVESDGGGVGAMFVLYDFYADALCPNGKLFDGGGSKCIAGGEDDILVIVAENKAKLCDACGFSGAVDTGDEDDGWAGFGVAQLSVAVRPIVFDVLFQEWNNIIGGCDFSAAVGISQVRDELVGGLYANIVAYEGLFEPVKEGFINISAEGQDGRKRGADFAAGFAEAVFEELGCFSENSHNCLLKIIFEI